MSGVEQDRLIDLEIKISHQEMAIEKLQEMVYAQDAAIQNLEKILKMTRERIEAVARGEGQVGPANEKPPHY
jgi:SlyX protein